MTAAPATVPHIHAQPNAERQLWAAYRLILTWPKRTQQPPADEPRRDDDQQAQHGEARLAEAAA
jgi:hypothetical protein